MLSSYHMGQKAFIKASCIDNIHTREKFFAAATFEGLLVISVLKEWKTLWFTLVCMSLFYISREESVNQIHFIKNKFSFLHEDL